jgi:hypothetical protein
MDSSVSSLAWTFDIVIPRRKYMLNVALLCIEPIQAVDTEDRSHDCSTPTDVLHLRQLHPRL